MSVDWFRLTWVKLGRTESREKNPGWNDGGHRSVAWGCRQMVPQLTLSQGTGMSSCRPARWRQQETPTSPCKSQLSTSISVKLARHSCVTQETQQLPFTVKEG